jgi:two-component system chemotaxis response regulator CheV
MIEDIKTNDDFNEEDDELDIIKLVSTNANNSNQYLIFNGSNGELYAKNVSKIEELIVYKDLEIAHNSTGSLIIGTADVRGQMTPIVNFDEWFGNKVLDDSEYELVVLASYGGYRFGIVVKSVEYIMAIEPEDMVDNSISNPKTTFITKVKVGSENRLCTIFDSDKMLLDIFENSEKSNLEKISNVTSKRVSEKLVLFADDSKFIREMVKKLLLTMELNYKIFEDGKYLIEELKKLNPNDIGLIITDLEMPNLGGKEVIKFIRENSKFNDINIIVHTNMSNNIMEEDLLKAGANQLIKKIDMEELSQSIKKNIR